MIKDSTKDVFLAIDANAIIHRAFHAYPPSLQTPEGVQVNAVYGFTVMLLEALELFGPKYVLCAMDTQAPTFRHENFPDYKATRKPTDMSLVEQFPLVEEILKAFNIPVIKKEGYEADDILGTVARYVSEGLWNGENLDMYILSGDRDLLQLIDERVYVALPNGNFKNIVVYDRGKTIEKYGYSPEQVTDYKALVGDPSDNIPGVKGVGDKTALKLLEKYNDLENIYININEIEGRARTLIAEGVEQAEFSKQLATIERNVSIDIHLTDCILKDLDRGLLNSTFKKYAFKSLMRKLDDIFGKEVLPTSTSQLDMFNEGNREFKWRERDDLLRILTNAKRLTIAYIASDESEEKQPYICLRGQLTDGKTEDIVTRELDILKDINTQDVLIYNFEELVTKSSSIDIQKIEKYYDVLLGEHLLHSENRNFKIKDLAFKYSTKILNEKLPPFLYTDILDVVEESSIAQRKKMDTLVLYEYTYESIKRFLKVEENLLLSSLQKIELPISVILSHMESRGMMIDQSKLEDLREKLEEDISKTTKEIYDSVGHEFNINSPKQLSDVLFRELDLPNKSKGSTKESVLASMKGIHPIIEPLLYYREVTKVQSTYVQPLLENSTKENGNLSVHTDFKQTGTTSGRFSSVNPNMQNLPVEGKWAKRLRRCFVAREGFTLVGIDYSQMELRIMADISKDELLIKDFVDGLDIHTSTAARVLGKEVEEVTKKERSLGKTVNFGMIFGQTSFGLSSLLGIDRETARKYILSYFNHYKGVEEYMRKTETEAYERGYVQTMFGTARNISGIRSRNSRLRSAASREAINMPIQGSEADIMKLVMKELYILIREKYSKRAYILLQIHDEILFEVEEQLVDTFIKDAQEIMLDTVSLEVPLELHISKGNSLDKLK
jgi:DNA polymerase-1